MSTNKMNFNQLDKYCHIITSTGILCKCTHRVIVPASLDRVLCSWCGHWVYRTPELEKQYKDQEEKNKFKKEMLNLLKK